VTIVDHPPLVTDVPDPRDLFEEARRRRRRRRLASGALVIVLGMGALAWWASGGTANGPPPGHPGTGLGGPPARAHADSQIPASWTNSTFHGDSLTVSFDHPGSWRSELKPLSFHYSDIFGFLSNFTLQPFCHSYATSYDCIWAQAAQFPANGVLMTFGTVGYGPGIESGRALLGPGRATPIGGRAAHRVSGNGRGCLGTGATASVSYAVVDGKTQGIFGVTFCYRGAQPGKFRSEADGVAQTLRLNRGPSGVGAQPS
jgi:hypothetical protein